MTSQHTSADPKQLRAMLEREGALETMAGLPAPNSWPSWARSAADIAIGHWVAAWVGDDRHRAVKAALAAVTHVAPRLPPDSEELAVSHEWLEAQVRAVSAWLASPSTESQATAKASFDPTRQTHAWSDFDLSDAWIAEAADFAIHAVWSGDLQGYITPPPPQTCAALAAVSAVHALIQDGVGVDASVLEIAGAIAGALAEPS